MSNVKPRKPMKLNKLFLTIILFTNFAFGQDLKFKDLDNLNPNSKTQIETFIKTKGYVYTTTESHSKQWKSKTSGNVLQFNGEGVLLYSTYNKQTYSNIVSDLKKSSYKFLGNKVIDNVSAEIYSVAKSKVVLSTVKNPINGKSYYQITFLKS